MCRTDSDGSVRLKTSPHHRHAPLHCLFFLPAGLVVHHHLVCPCGIHRDGGRGRDGAHNGVVRDGDNRLRYHGHERCGDVGALAMEHALHVKGIQSGKQEHVSVADMGSPVRLKYFLSFAPTKKNTIFALVFYLVT